MRRIAGALVVIAALGMLAMPATAAKPKVKTTVTIEGNNGAARAVTQWNVYGAVESPRRRCEVGRKIVLFRGTGTEKVKLGFDFADSSGHWAVRIPSEDFSAGDYIAKAPKATFRRFVCKPDSDQIEFA